MDEYRAVLFWVFLGFFLLIGLVSLLAILGVRTDPRFKKWAVMGFVVEVAGAVFGLFQMTFAEETPIFVTLIPPQGIMLRLTQGHYTFDEPTRSGVKTYSGRITIALGAGDLWQAKLPQNVLSKAVKLTFQDESGGWWSAQFFQPNYNRQNLTKSDKPQSTTMPSLERSLVSTAHAATIEKKESLKFDNYARARPDLQFSDGRRYYEWRVFLDESPAVLAQIAEVQYYLHPTFLQPLQVRTDPDTKFALDQTGWGQFTMIITIRYKDGRIEKTSYFLNFSKGWPQ